MEGLNRREEALAVGKFTVAEFARRDGRQRCVRPSAGLEGVEPDAFLGAGKDFLAGASTPARRLEVMRHVAALVDYGDLPRQLGVSGLFVSEHLGADAGVVFVGAAMERLNDEVPALGVDLDPLHAVDRRLVGERDGFPFLGRVSGGLQVEHRAAIDRVGRIPAGADGDLALTVDDLGGDADVIEFG